ncbi:hypothetical protein ATANTOWER_021707 [Ataeniobius toweri]|uniref:Uncharacterized protein n=1 Tax=Ataeniobius toweri TaxID=208326 RepID=A0ABU7CHY2_9TELE|nr:hypothetical protein [Ataeniobius toweri]
MTTTSCSAPMQVKNIWDQSFDLHLVPAHIRLITWFSQTLGSSSLSPVPLAFNETSACPGHILFLLIR